MRRMVILLASSILATAACASSPARTASDGCALGPADSAYTAGSPLYLECAVDTPAEVVAAPIDYVPASRPLPARPGVTCYTAEVQFVVGMDGRPEPETVRLLRTNDSALGLALLQGVPAWRYKPARRDGMPVRQLVRERRSIALAVTVSSSRQSRPSTPRGRPACT